MDVQLIGSGFTTDYLLAFLRKLTTHYLASQIAAKKAYQQAKIKPEEIDPVRKKSSNGIDFAEVHDAFTSEEIIAYEDLGFAKIGEGAELIRKGITNLDGPLPVNPSGGLKAKDHLISVTGLAQIYEVTNQLRGRCHERQVKKSKGWPLPQSRW